MWEVWDAVTLISSGVSGHIPYMDPLFTVYFTASSHLPREEDHYFRGLLTRTFNFLMRLFPFSASCSGQATQFRRADKPAQVEHYSKVNGITIGASSRGVGE